MLGLDVRPSSNSEGISSVKFVVLERANRTALVESSPTVCNHQRMKISFTKMHGLGNDFVDGSKRSISMEAIERTLKVLEKFAFFTANHGIEIPWAVSTGIFRKADNTDYFLGLIKEHIGFEVEVISGEKEAILTRMGILHFGQLS